MSRGKGMLFALVALTAIGTIMVKPVTAVTTSEPVAATDERAPEAVTGVTAFPSASGVEVSWELSSSDFVRQSPTGTDFTSGGSYTNVNDVAAYNIYRDGEPAGTVAAGEMTFVDLDAVGSSIIYHVTAVDAAGNESAASETAIVSLGPPPTAVVVTPDGDYGVVDPDDVADQTIEIENTAEDAEASLTVAVTVIGDGFSASEATITVAPGEDGTVDVFFDAAAVDNFNGIYTGTVTIRTNDPDNREITYETIAEIIDGIGLPELSVAPASIRFGGIVVGESVSRTITISNVGGPTLEGTVALSGDDVFTISGDGTYSLDGEEDEEITVTFAPTDSISYAATVTVTSNDEAAASTDIVLTGRGTAELEGPGVIEAEVTKAELTFDTTLDFEDEAAVDAFEADLIAALAELLGIDPSRIIITSLAPGSVIVNFTIAQTKVDEAEPSATEALDALEVALADTTVDNPVTAIAPVTAITDVSETVVLQPKDADGNPIRGWFTRGAFGNQVGFDDFFAFADNFGSTDADPDFDVIYDISSATGDPDGAVDFDDFFAFADDFGKVVANAAEIIAALQ